MNKKIISASIDLFMKKNNVKEKYSEFLLDSFKLDNESYIFQGITKVKNMYFITAYKKGSNSIIFIYDEDFILIKKTNLYNNAHVGGIAYDGKKTVYITDKHGTVSIFDLDEILKYDMVIPKIERIDVSDKLKNIFDQTACAYITYFNNKLYLGNFNSKKDSILKIYDKDLKILIKEIPNFQDLVQGITLNNHYLIVSSSFGVVNKSLITIYKYDKNSNLTFIKSIKLPPMLEQIYLDEDKLICLFEINSYIKKDKYKDILILDLNSIIR